MRYAVATSAAPVLNTPDFAAVFGGRDGSSLPLDGQQLLRAVEIVAFPKTKFQILEEQGNICRIFTRDYPGNNLYIDKRFLLKTKEEPPERALNMPSISEILASLLFLEGLPYIWGGNWSKGISKIPLFYPPKIPLEKLSELARFTWHFKGLDCTGLLYEATAGCTPRNSSDLLSYGQSVPIQHLSQKGLLGILKPLDLIVWKGHVVIVLDAHTTIESNVEKGGVIRLPLEERLSEISKERVPVDNWDETAHLGQRFVIRRWHPDILLT